MANKKETLMKSTKSEGATGSVLNNINVRPTRWQTAKHDAAYLAKTAVNEIKSDLKSPKLKSKARGVAVAGTALVNTPGIVGASLFNVISGQARYNKNKRAGLERGDKEFKVRNSSTPLAETEFND